jgi:hypothetical protein
MTDRIAVAARPSLDEAGAARLAIAAIFFVNGFTFANLIPHIPSLQARLGIGTGLLGLALLGLAAGALVSMPLAGVLVARIGSRTVTLVSAVLLCLLTPLPLLAPDLPVLAAVLVAFGAANGAMDVSMNAHGVAVENRLGRPVMSSLHALYSIGGLVGAGGTVGLLSLGVAPMVQITGAALAGLLVVVVAVARFLLPPAVDIARGGTKFALPHGSLLLLGLMGFGILMTEGAMADWTAVYLRNDLGLDAALAGAGFAVFSLAMAAGRLTGDRLVAATGPAVLVRGGATLAAFGLAGALVFHDPLAALIGFGCVGLGLANIVPILFSAAGRTPGVEPGTAIAAVTTSGYCGFLAGPPLVGFAADQIGLPAALGLLVGFMVLAALAGGVVRR